MTEATPSGHFIRICVVGPSCEYLSKFTRWLSPSSHERRCWEGSVRDLRKEHRLGLQEPSKATSFVLNSRHCYLNCQPQVPAPLNPLGSFLHGWLLRGHSGHSAGDVQSVWLSEPEPGASLQCQSANSCPEPSFSGQILNLSLG